jgi:hypothetical protein
MFVAAGVLVLLGEIIQVLGSANAALPWLAFLTDLVLTIAFAVLFVWRVDILARGAFLVAAIGWALLALADLPVSVGLLGTIGTVLAIVSVLVGGIVVFVRQLLSRVSSLLFLVTMLVTVIELLSSYLPAALDTVLAIVWGVLFVGLGLVLARKR